MNIGTAATRGGSEGVGYEGWWWGGGGRGGVIKTDIATKCRRPEMSVWTVAVSVGRRGRDYYDDNTNYHATSPPRGVCVRVSVSECECGYRCARRTELPGVKHETSSSQLLYSPPSPLAIFPSLSSPPSPHSRLLFLVNTLLSLSLFLMASASFTHYSFSFKVPVLGSRRFRRHQYRHWLCKAGGQAVGGREGLV